MFMKFATAEVVRVYDHRERVAGRKIGSFDYEPRTDGNFLYASVRACTADVPNLNYDMLPHEELKTAYKTFIGAYNYLNHDNQDPAKARGAVIDAVYHDEDPDDRWIECLIEMDEDRCPKLCSLIRSGDIDTVSMGCNVRATKCSVCGNEAEYPFQFCEHIQQKGRTFNGHLAYEICEGIDFFELSWVYDPADPSAYTTALADSGHESLECEHPYDKRDSQLIGGHPDYTAKVAAKTAKAFSGTNIATYLKRFYKMYQDLMEKRGKKLGDFSKLKNGIVNLFVKDGNESAKEDIDENLMFDGSFEANGGSYAKYHKYNDDRTKRIDYTEYTDEEGKKHCGFITYDVVEHAENGKMVERLKMTGQSKSDDYGSFEECYDDAEAFSTGKNKKVGYTKQQLDALAESIEKEIPEDVKDDIDSSAAELEDMAESAAAAAGSDDDAASAEPDASDEDTKAVDGPAKRCKHIKDDGEQCGNLTDDPDGYCYLHKKGSADTGSMMRDMVMMAMECLALNDGDIVMWKPEYAQSDEESSQMFYVMEPRDDGKCYIKPVDWDEAYGRHAPIQMVRQDWMEKVGCEVPKMRCAHVNSSGKRCTRNAEAGSNYCWQHISSHVSSYATAPRVPEAPGADGDNVEVCPLCGDPNFDGEFCNICGFEQPPKGFDDIEIDDGFEDFDESEDAEGSAYGFEPDDIDVEQELDDKTDELLNSADDGEVDDDEMFFA